MTYTLKNGSMLVSLLPMVECEIMRECENMPCKLSQLGSFEIFPQAYIASLWKVSSGWHEKLY